MREWKVKIGKGGQESVSISKEITRMRREKKGREGKGKEKKERGGKGGRVKGMGKVEKLTEKKEKEK